MTDRWGRTLSGLAALAALWVLIYWWWQPRGVTITYDDGSTSTRQLNQSLTPAVQTTIPPIQPPPMVPQAQQLAPQPSPLAVVPPRFRDYTIREGDTLQKIAQRELGTDRHWEAIARSNPLKDIEKLRPGRTIRIPLDPTNIQGQPLTAIQPTPPPIAKQQPTQQQASQPAPQPAQPPTPREYTVKPGDTLTVIAQRELGNKNAINTIIQLNNLTNPDNLRVGQKLKLPPR